MQCTAKRLAERIETINDRLKNDGSLIRFESGGRNGYSAVDEYSVDSDGKRVGSGYNRNIGCGTPIECIRYAEQAYSNEVVRVLRENCTCGHTDKN